MRKEALAGSPFALLLPSPRATFEFPTTKLHLLHDPWPDWHYRIARCDVPQRRHFIDLKLPAELRRLLRD